MPPRSESEEVVRLLEIKVRARGSFEGGLVVCPPLGKVKVEQLVSGRVMMTDVTGEREPVETENEKGCKKAFTI